MAGQEYSILLILILAVSVKSIPTPYVSSMSAGDDGGMTWMGWAPQTGMTAFASSSNPWTNRGWKNTGIQPDRPEQTDQDQPEEEQPSLTPPKKWSKGEDQSSPGTSNAQASLNAWFPIMLGMFPPQDGARSNQREQAPLDSITAVANSVNHGSRGVASSHAVAYGGEYSKFRHLRNNHDSSQYGTDLDNRQYKTLPKFS